ncbi:MAG: 50S ribosomal protein L15 [Roseitalea sp.]|nr:50S ribosomal protein L15 [Roseitalea sp.]MBO6950864.1 50S ribosomal protein L15 [Rhizobiaceae bacterium]MBO6591149.1 50S ribosomal protein L15 [Roseitalea sp.]MBO6599004.1 50S ribosomal protein L15 [Roseitalea sp.]MBO6613414.1 50S ribosomal protein L15 [Roseitalea sp.]
MKLNELRDNEGARKSRSRVGRGIGSGKGKTGGRGVKGQKSRSGVSINGYEGGQMPIYRRLPKRGFNNPFPTDYNIVSIARLEQAVEAKKLDAKKPVTAEALVDAGVLRRAKDGVRVLADGEAKTKFALEVAGASKAAVAKIEKAGGSVTILAPKAEADAE